MILVIIVEIIAILLIGWVVVGFFSTIFRGYAPFVISRKKVIDLVINVINPQPNQVVYELGSGGANFLQKVENKFPNVKLIGFEYSIIIFLFSSLFLKLKHSKIKICRKNIFDVNLKEADIIYGYLFPSMMLKLGKKIQTECKPGTIFVSSMFSVPGWKPMQTLKQGSGTIYFYQV